MNCSDYLEWLSAETDGALTEEQQRLLDAHLSECAECRCTQRTYRLLQTAICDLEEDPPEGLASGVMYRIGQENQSAKQHRFAFGRGTALAAVAAALVILVGTGTVTLPKTSRTQIQAVTAATETAAEPPEGTADAVTSEPSEEKAYLSAAPESSEAETEQAAAETAAAPPAVLYSVSDETAPQTDSADVYQTEEVWVPSSEEYAIYAELDLPDGTDIPDALTGWLVLGSGIGDVYVATAAEVQAFLDTATDYNMTVTVRAGGITEADYGCVVVLAH